MSSQVGNAIVAFRASAERPSGLLKFRSVPVRVVGHPQSVFDVGRCRGEDPEVAVQGATIENFDEHLPVVIAEKIE